jgi:hypothetical protein
MTADISDWVIHDDLRRLEEVSTSDGTTYGITEGNGEDNTET